MKKRSKAERIKGLLQIFSALDDKKAEFAAIEVIQAMSVLLRQRGFKYLVNVIKRD
jgi:hypothetical protein